MEVVSDDLRRHREQPLEMLDPFDERQERLVVLEIADVVPHPGPRPSSDAERVLELRPAREDRPLGGVGERHAGRDVPARPPQDHPAGPVRSGDDAEHRIVGARLDGPIVDEEQVCDAGQTLQRVLVAVGDGLVRHVPAGHDERRAGEVREQHMVQGRVRHHHAQLGRPGSHRRRHVRGLEPRAEHDRAGGAREQQPLALAHADEQGGSVERGHHQRERLVLALLASAQSRHRRLVVGPAGKVEAADALDRHDAPLAQRGGGGGDRVARAADRSLSAAREEQRGQGPARRAGVRLRMEAAVRRIVVLVPAGAAHPKAGHRRERPVVGDALDDREPRAAVRAVDERVAVPAVVRVEELAEAVVAGRGVGRDLRVRRAAVAALDDLEARVADGLAVLGDHALDRGKRRGVRSEPGEEPLNRRLAALDLEEHAVRIVQDEPRQPQLARQPVDVGAEAHALHHALHPHMGPPAGRHGHGTAPAGGGPTRPRSTW